MFPSHDPATTQSKTFRGFANLVKKGKKFYGKVQDAYVAEDDFYKSLDLIYLVLLLLG